jgi:hypothetical protein
MQFHPEIKGELDSAGHLKSKPFATMGIGQPLADPFIAHAHRVLFGVDTLPTIAQGRLLVTWTLGHVLRHATAGVGGDLRIAQLQRGNGWRSESIDVDEAQQQVREIEAYIGRFGHPEVPAAQVDLREQLQGR